MSHSTSGSAFLQTIDKHCNINLKFSSSAEAFHTAKDIHEKCMEISDTNIAHKYIYLKKYTTLIAAISQSNIWQMKKHVNDKFYHQEKFVDALNSLTKIKNIIIKQYDGNNNDHQPPKIAPKVAPTTVVISRTMISTFMNKFAMENTNKNIETGGILLGSKNESTNTFTVTHILLPKQSGTANAVFMKNENEWAQVCDTLSLQFGGWIHTHPKQQCFMSSVDLHTQLNMQTLNNSAIGIVVAPTDCTEIFRLTSSGVQFLSNCTTNGHHVHANKHHEDISPLLYEKAKNIVIESSMQCIFMDIRKSHPLQVLCQQIGDILSFTCRNPWAFFLKEGHKILENKYTGLKSDKLNKPIALRVSGTPYTKKEMHEIYDIPVVQKYLKLNDSTKTIWNKPTELDTFFGSMKSQVIAIITICQVIKNTPDIDLSQYEFFSVPKKTNYAWIVGQCVPLSESIPCRAGTLNVQFLGNEHRQILQKIKDTLKATSHIVAQSEEKDISNNSNNGNTSITTSYNGITIGQKYDIYNKVFKIINVKVKDVKIVCNEHWYKIKYKIKNRNKCCWVSKDRFMID
eukprot:294253_1